MAYPPLAILEKICIIVFVDEYIEAKECLKA